MRVKPAEWDALVRKAAARIVARGGRLSCWDLAQLTGLSLWAVRETIEVAVGQGRWPFPGPVRFTRPEEQPLDTGVLARRCAAIRRQWSPERLATGRMVGRTAYPRRVAEWDIKGEGSEA